MLKWLRFPKINRHYQKKAKNLNLINPKASAIAFIQRFWQVLNPNAHFHTLCMDGDVHENILGEEVFYKIIPTHEGAVQI